VTTTFWPTIATAVQNTVRTTRAPMAWDPASLLMSRFGFGIESKTRADLARCGLDGWWQTQLTFSKGAGAGYAAHAAVAAQGPLLQQSPGQVRAWLKANGNEYGWEAMDQLTRVTLGLQAWSRGQVYESVVDFFANHLNVANHSDGVWTTRHTMDRDVIRRYALGSYASMLVASARNPAMLQYLSLASSSKSAINENYGRELLELHTVGIGNYTETDVQNSARILTGRSLDADYNYLYKPERHWVGPIKVMGFSHVNDSAATGEAAGDAYLRYLAHHPATAKRLAQKLCVHFVSDNPSPTLVAELARIYLRTGTQIVPMLSAILRSTEFWASRGAKVRRPAENLIATVRALGLGPGELDKSLQSLHWMSSAVGQVPLDWSAPNGYPAVASAWRSSGSLLNLWAYHRGLSQNWYGGFAPFDPASLYGAVKPRTSGEAITQLCARLTGSRFPTAHVQALQTFLEEPATTPIANSRLRWYLSHLIPLILDAPQHALR
jgi:hypothetical protein